MEITLTDGKKSDSVGKVWNFPDPVIGIAVEPKTKSRVLIKLGIGFAKLAEEDPTFQVKNRRGIRSGTIIFWYG